MSHFKELYLINNYSKIEDKKLNALCNNVDWWSLSNKHKLPLEFISKFRKKLHIKTICEKQVLSDDFIVQNYGWLDMKVCCAFQIIDINTILSNLGIFKYYTPVLSLRKDIYTEEELTALLFIKDMVT